ncbi:MAG: hypothetical protein AAF533_25910 [Acidobacteriota bacterium]
MLAPARLLPACALALCLAWPVSADDRNLPGRVRRAAAAKGDDPGQADTGGRGKRSKRKKADADAPPDEPLTWLRVGAVHLGDGTVHAPGELLLSGKKVHEVGSSLEPDEDRAVRRLDWPDAVITPPLVDPAVLVPLGSGEQRGAVGNAALTTKDARDSHDPWLKELRGRGVDAVTLVPDGAGSFHGRAVTIGTKGPGAKGAPVLVAEAGLITSLTSGSGSSAGRAAARARLEAELENAARYSKKWKEYRKQEKADEGKKQDQLDREKREQQREAERRKRGKTPRIELKKRVKKPNRNEGQEILVKVLEKKVPLRLLVDREEDVATALELVQRRDLPAVLAGCIECRDWAGTLEQSQLVVLLDPLNEPLREGDRGTPSADTIAALGEAEVRIAVTGGGRWPEGPTWLRTAAAELAGRGLEPAEAVAAMTGEAAVAAGLVKYPDRLAAGEKAGLIIWSGDPLDPSSTILHRVTDGKGLPEPEPTPGEDDGDTEGEDADSHSQTAPSTQPDDDEEADS